VRIRGVGSFVIVCVAAGCGAFVGTSSGADGPADMDGGSGDPFAQDASGSNESGGGDAGTTPPPTPSDAGDSGDASKLDAEAGVMTGTGFCGTRSGAVFCADFDEAAGLLNAGFPTTSFIDGLATATLDPLNHASGTKSAKFSFPTDQSAQRKLLLRTAALGVSTVAFSVHWKMLLNVLPTMGEVWTVLEASTDVGGNYVVEIDGTGMKCGGISQGVSAGQWHELVLSVGAGKVTCGVINGGFANATDMQAETFKTVTLSVEGVGTAPEDFVYDVDDVIVTSP
jgi:hypothetical protein